MVFSSGFTVTNWMRNHPTLGPPENSQTLELSHGIHEKWGIHQDDSNFFGDSAEADPNISVVFFISR